MAEAESCPHCKIRENLVWLKRQRDVVQHNVVGKDDLDLMIHQTVLDEMQLAENAKLAALGKQVVRCKWCPNL